MEDHEQLPDARHVAIDIAIAIAIASAIACA